MVWRYTGSQRRMSETGGLEVFHFPLNMFSIFSCNMTVENHPALVKRFTITRDLLLKVHETEQSTSSHSPVCLHVKTGAIDQLHKLRESLEKDHDSLPRLVDHLINGCGSTAGRVETQKKKQNDIKIDARVIAINPEEEIDHGKWGKDGGGVAGGVIGGDAGGEGVSGGVSGRPVSGKHDGLSGGGSGGAAPGVGGGSWGGEGHHFVGSIDLRFSVDVSGALITGGLGQKKAETKVEVYNPVNQRQRFIISSFLLFKRFKLNLCISIFELFPSYL